MRSRTPGPVDGSRSRRGPLERDTGLHLALLLAGVTPGDDLLVSTCTFVATANALLQCGATPVFVESSAADWNIDPNLVAQGLAECSKRNAGL